jgi:hypothetical protein
LSLLSIKIEKINSNKYPISNQAKDVNYKGVLKKLKLLKEMKFLN